MTGISDDSAPGAQDELTRAISTIKNWSFEQWSPENLDGAKISTDGKHHIATILNAVGSGALVRASGQQVRAVEIAAHCHQIAQYAEMAGTGKALYIDAIKRRAEAILAALTPAPQPEGQVRTQGAPWPDLHGQTLTPAPDAAQTSVRKMHRMDMGDGRILTSEMPIPEPIRAPDAAQTEECWWCEGTGLALDDAGEPGICHKCKGDTVIPAAPAPGIAEAARVLLDGTSFEAITEACRLIGVDRGSFRGVLRALGGRNGG